MTIHIRTSTGRLGPAGIGAAVLLLMMGGAIVLSGLALLLALAVAGTAIGAGVVLFRRLTGRSGRVVHSRRQAKGLDPALEVFPIDSGAPDDPTSGATRTHRLDDDPGR
jgi:hypothetical protein